MKTLTIQLEDALYRCNKCGFCQATCPYYLTTGEEWSVARGRLRLTRAIMQGKLPLSDGAVRAMYHCFSCRACNVTCPSGVPVDEILLEARMDLNRQGYLPDPLAQMGHTIVTTGNLTGEEAEARRFWLQNLDWAPPQSGQHETIYFVGCVSSFYPQAYGLPQSMAWLLERARTDYAVLGGDEVCCGYPLYVSGLQEEARALAQANVRTVREAGARRVMTTCPSCYRAWREFYPHLLGEELGVEVVHSTQWLADAGLTLHPLEKKVTYHDPCDLGRGSGIYDPPREFLKSNGLHLVEMSNTRAEALCCGGGGNMETLNPAASRTVAQMRMQQASATGAEWVVTACPQCKRTLSSVRSDSPLRVMDIVELARKLAVTD
ncbi:MAG: (Fe-S)-binding protein [Anaerolineae bacterium]